LTSKKNEDYPRRKLSITVTDVARLLYTTATGKKNGVLPGSLEKWEEYFIREWKGGGKKRVQS